MQYLQQINIELLFDVVKFNQVFYHVTQQKVMIVDLTKDYFFVVTLNALTMNCKSRYFKLTSNVFVPLIPIHVHQLFSMRLS
jgi:hypothetical protein